MLLKQEYVALAFCPSPPALSPPTSALTLSLPIVGTDFDVYERGDLTGDALHAAARSTVDGSDHFPSAASPGSIPGHRGADCQACSTLHLAQRYVTPPLGIINVQYKSNAKELYYS